MSSFVVMDLLKLCNHKFIYDVKPEDESAGLDGTYLAAKNVPFGEETTINGIPYKFCFGEYDNVLSEGQRLSAGGFADKLHIIAFTNWGDTFDQIKIEYCDGSFEWIKLPFLDWSHKQQIFWQDVTSVRETVDTPFSGITTGALSQLVCFHHTMAEIKGKKKIDSIVLPDNFWLHVFAITLEKEN